MTNIKIVNFLIFTISGIMFNTSVAHNLTLKEAYEKSIETSPIYHSFSSQYNTAESQNQITAGKLLPNISIVGSHSKQHSIAGSEKADFSIDNAKIQLSQVIFDFNKWNTWMSAISETNAAESMLIYQQQGFIIQVADAYFNVLKQFDILKFNTANMKALSELSKQINDKYQVGMVDEVELKRVQSRFYEANARVKTQKAYLKDAYYQLYQLTGDVDKDFSKLKNNLKFTMLEKKNMEELSIYATTKNFLLNSEHNKTISQYDKVLATTGNFFPRIGIVAEYARNKVTGDVDKYREFTFSPANLANAYIGINVDWNIFTGGSDFALEVQNANLYEAQKYNTQQIHRDVINNTQSDYLTIQADIKQIEALESSVSSYEVSYKSFYDQYKVGTSVLTDILQQITQLYEVKSLLSQAKYKYIIDVLNLKYDLGTLNKQDIYDFNDWLE